MERGGGGGGGGLREGGGVLDLVILSLMSVSDMCKEGSAGCKLGLFNE